MARDDGANTHLQGKCGERHKRHESGANQRSISHVFVLLGG
jgi:hypothetical protein